VLALNVSSFMTGLWKCLCEVEFVALCGSSDVNVSKLYRLCTTHSYFGHIAQNANKIANFNGKNKVKQSLHIP
jgi:hypothetical protein